MLQDIRFYEEYAAYELAAHHPDPPSLHRLHEASSILSYKYVRILENAARKEPLLFFREAIRREYMCPDPDRLHIDRLRIIGRSIFDADPAPTKQRQRLIADLYLLPDSPPKHTVLQ